MSSWPALKRVAPDEAMVPAWRGGGKAGASRDARKKNAQIKKKKV
jgi:hypothetical protein